jgi:hypothetical protein
VSAPVVEQSRMFLEAAEAGPAVRTQLAANAPADDRQTLAPQQRFLLC